MQYKVLMPKLGESIVSATILQWFKKEGDTIVADEPLLEVSTDKVNSEIPAPVTGTLIKIIALEDEEYDVEALLCTIETSQTESEPLVETKAESKCTASVEKNNFYSPAVMTFAKEKGVSLSDLEKIPRSGSSGRLSKKDILAYLGSSPAVASSDRVKMTQMRKAIADNMVKSFYEAPHATLVTEVDVTDILNHIKENKAAFFKTHEAKLTITTFITKAIAVAVQEFPFVNSFLDGDTIVLKSSVNVGIAVSVDQSIVVPVIRSCQAKSIEELAKQLASISTKAREHKLKPDDVKEGTITFTNFGMSDAIIGIPIIRYPEVAIIGMGAIRKSVVPLKDDSIGIRQMVHISLTFDHRVLDGMYGCGFLSAIKKCLEDGRLI